MPGFRSTVTACGLAVLLLGSAAGALAQEQEESDFRPKFEFTPFAGYRFGGDFTYEDNFTPETNISVGDAGTYGIDLGLYRDRASFYELLWSHQNAPMDTSGLALGDVDLAIDYYHVGGTLLFTNANWFVPYLSMTLGMTRFDPDEPGLSTESDFSLSLGTGVRMPINEKLSVLVGFRGYLTFVDSNTALFCQSNGGATCLFHISGSSFFQVEGQLGLTLRL